MSKLYDIVNKTINAPSMIEAEQILFGSDGIVINSNEYYKNIISNFGKKKESIIRKTVGSNGKTQLIFDLNDCNDMWNILFIYNYYIRYIDDKIESLNQDIKKYKIVQKNLENEKKKLTSNDLRYHEITHELEKISSNLKELGDLKTKYSSYKNESLKKHVVQLENMKNIDEDKLKQYLDKLKEAVNCIQKMRDSLEHSNDNLKIDSIVSIDNPKDKFEISIPIEYLDGFNKGRIIANEEDKILVEQTNDISSPLLESLNYDIKKIESFFYNVEPNQLGYILNLCDNNIQILYQLPVWCFYERNNMYITYFLNGKDKIDSSNVIQLKNIKYVPYPKDKQDYSSVIDLLEYLRDGKQQLSEDDIQIFNILGKIQIIDAKFVIYQLKELKKIGVDFLKIRDNLNSFSTRSHLDNILEFFNIVGVDEKSKTFIYNLLNSTFYSLDQLIKIYEIYNQRNSDLVFNMAHNDSVDDNIVLLNFFDNNKLYDKTKIFQMLSVLECNDENKIDNIIYILDKILLKYNTITEIDAYIIKYCLEYNLDLDFDIIDELILFFNKMKQKSSVYNFQIELLIKLIKNNSNIMLDDILMDKLILIQDGYMMLIMLESTRTHQKNLEYEIKIFNFLNEKCKSNDLFENIKFVDRLSLIDNDIDFIRNYKQEIVDKNLLRFIECISIYLNIFNSKKTYIKNSDQLDNIEKVIDDRLEKCRKILKLFYNNGKTISSDDNKLLCKYVEFSLSIIKSINVDELGNVDINQLYFVLENIEKYDIYIEEGNIDALRFYFGKISRAFVYDLISPESVRRKEDYQSNNIDILLRIFDNDYNKLKELPYEFFTCDPTLISEMLQQYNLNVSKSIFGIKNPKIIATLVYANSVLSNYNKDMNTMDMDIQPYSIIGDMYVDNFKYRNNIDENIGRKYNSSEFVEQFKLLDENNLDRSMDDIRKTILNKFRNACAHFRFKLVKDNNGNIIEDKIYIYDEDNNGINNFNLIIDLNEFVSIVREVEVHMEMQKNKEEQSNQKSR